MGAISHMLCVLWWHPHLSYLLCKTKSCHCKLLFMLCESWKQLLIELNWIELNWIELNWIELNWIELNWIELKNTCKAQFGKTTSSRPIKNNLKKEKKDVSMTLDMKLLYILVSIALLNKQQCTNALWMIDIFLKNVSLSSWSLVDIYGELWSCHK